MARALSQASARPSRAKPLVEELIAAASHGDKARFDGLFDLWLSVVFTESVRSTGDRAAAEELTRKVLVRVIQAASR